MNQVENELMHYGVLGMHWGQKKSQSQIRSEIKSVRKEKKEWDKVAKTASTKRFLGNPSASDIAKNQSKHYDKKIRKLRIEEEYNKVDKKFTNKGVLKYNEATKVKAAKYIVDHNMPMDKAIKLAKASANRNGAALLGASGMMLYSSIKK